MDGVSVLGKDTYSVYRAFKFFQRTYKYVHIAARLPLSLKAFLVFVLSAFVVLQFNCDCTARNECEIVRDAGTDPHTLEVHCNADAALAFVGDVENQEPRPHAGFYKPLLAVMLQAGFVILDGFASPTHRALFS